MVWYRGRWQQVGLLILILALPDCTRGVTQTA